ncbi:hypothetical protein CI15_33225 [Paraburkholderia monticola]|uniref:Uncharacterized protein n=1 Tax=Paraburkholderia monticola TaxID=1399968 RepID=A0A149PBJ4_9BURK|nr:hypothetical protein CI15_33225 [Paraburkholderia monticola]
MGNNLPVFAAVKDEWTLMLAETKVFHLSDKKVMISGRMNVYRPQDHLRERTVQKRRFPLAD